MPEILFVCTGNICRSPMAEYLFNMLARERGMGHWQARSVGVAALPGDGISTHAQTVLKEEAIDSVAHRSRILEQESLEKAVVILTMTESHRDIVLARFPEYREKTYTLKEFAAKIGGDSAVEELNLDIVDPFGQGEEVYRAVRDEIKAVLETIIGNLPQFEIEAGNLMKRENNTNRGDIVKIAIGSDHAGYDLKMEIIRFLEEAGYEYKDMGTDSSQSVDYPDYGYQVAKAVADKEYDRGILICGTGIGMCITANKVEGVRAALCHDVFSAKATRNHNDSNVLTLGARVVGIGLALEIVKTWLGEEFEGGRHQNRLDKISSIERGEY